MTSKFAPLRKKFPGASRRIYMDVAARGLLSTNVRSAMDAFLDTRTMGHPDKAWMFAMVEECRDSFAALIGAEPLEIAVTKNVSDGINAFANAVPWRADDNVVICTALEHPANIFPWHNQSEIHGIELKVVPQQDGSIPFERLVEAIDDQTRVVTVSSVSFSPGLRFPVAELGAICRQRGIPLVVDAAQSIGILDVNVHAANIDVMAVSTQKGLLALYGSGFLYVRRGLAEILHPAYLSRAGVSIDSEHEASSNNDGRYDLAEAARRFDVGNHNYLAAVAVDASMRDLRSVGVGEIEAYVSGLARRLREGLADVGLPIFTGSGASSLAHIVAIGNNLSDDHDSSRDTRLVALHAFLIAQNVVFTIRRGVLRLSLHLYNNEDDVDQVIDLARQWMRRQAGAPIGRNA
jgi:selenocysteine lyase/cysteine desulfurase